MRRKYKAKYSGRIYNTKEEAIEDNRKYLSDASYRYGVKSDNYKSYYVDYNIPFIPEKKIVLSNAGLATGAVLSTNMLDSIADNADRAKLSLKTAIGLATKETTLNNNTIDLKNKAKISRRQSDILKSSKLNGYDINITQLSGDRDVKGSELVNFYPDDNPYLSTMRYLNPPPGTYSKPKVTSQEEFIKRLEQSEKYDDKRASIRQQQPKRSYLQGAFEYYKSNPNAYNPGQSNYPQLVEKRGNEVWNSPEVQSWYRRRLESAGKKSK